MFLEVASRIDYVIPFIDGKTTELIKVNTSQKIKGFKYRHTKLGKFDSV